MTYTVCITCFRLLIVHYGDDRFVPVTHNQVCGRGRAGGQFDSELFQIFQAAVISGSERGTVPGLQGWEKEWRWRLLVVLYSCKENDKNFCKPP